MIDTKKKKTQSAKSKCGLFMSVLYVFFLTFNFSNAVFSSNLDPVRYLIAFILFLSLYFTFNWIESNKKIKQITQINGVRLSNKVTRLVLVG